MSLYKILVIDYAVEVKETIEQSLLNSGLGVEFSVDWAGDSTSGINGILKSQPQLIFLNIELSPIHGIELIKMIRSSDHKSIQKVPIVVCTTRGLIQDYKSALECGADYYLIKPFFSDKIKEIVSRALQNNLTPDPFKLSPYPDIDTSILFNSPTETGASYIKFWGTRGSIPVSGKLYQRHGGNTSCLEVSSQNQTLIIDAGTGIQALGKELVKDKERSRHIKLIIGHTHWDHIIGFPFFAPAYDKDFIIDIYASTGFKKNIKELFSGMLDYDYFPVRLNEMQAQMNFHELNGEPIIIGNVGIEYTYANHPGAALCFKIIQGNRSIGYCTDNELFVGYHGHPNQIGDNHSLFHAYKYFLNFYKGVNTLVHEAQYTSEEYRTKVGWGHSSINNTALLVRYCQPKEWIFTHHDPTHHDELLNSKLRLHRTILDQCNIDCYVDKSFDFMKILI